MKRARDQPSLLVSVFIISGPLVYSVTLLFHSTESKTLTSKTSQEQKVRQEVRTQNNTKTQREKVI